MELHFVHKMKERFRFNKNITVIAVLFEVDNEEDSFFDNLILDNNAHEAVAEFSLNLAHAVYHMTHKDKFWLQNSL